MSGLLHVRVSDGALAVTFLWIFGFGMAYEAKESKDITAYIKLWKFCTYLTFSIQ